MRLMFQEIPYPAILVGQESEVRTVSMQSVSIIVWKDLFLEPFLLIFINLQFDTSGCILIYCTTLLSSILADTRVTNIWHFLLEEILLFLLFQPSYIVVASFLSLHLSSSSQCGT